jgi:hypothetical protein
VESRTSKEVSYINGSESRSRQDAALTVAALHLILKSENMRSVNAGVRAGAACCAPTKTAALWAMRGWMLRQRAEKFDE